MSTQIKTARDSGYSDEEIVNFLEKKDSDLGKKFQKGKEAGYTSSELLDYYQKTQEPSRTRSLLSAPVKGLVKGLSELASLSPIQFGPISSKLGEKVTEDILPTQEKLPEQLLERAGRIAPLVATGGEGLISKGAQLIGGTLAGQFAKENEAGPLAESLIESLGMGLGGAGASLAEGVSKSLKAPAEKFISGLAKPEAVDAKFVSKAIISPSQQEKAIKGLNQQAAQIAEKVTERELPLLKQIDEGIDFEKRYERKFKNIRNAAAKFKPDIDITPVSELLSKTRKKYKGIPKLHEEGRKVLKEVRALENNPQIRLDNLLKIFRSNNKKRKHIYETSRLTGKQEEYVDFLADLNRSIVKSFENTLPEDSLWLKEFKNMNSEYSQFQNSLKTVQLLKPILGQNPTAASLEKLSTDPKTTARLELALGKKGAEEISQLSKDLKTALKAVKEIPAKELKYWDTILPFSVFIPGLHGAGAILGGKKIYDLMRRGYGYILSSPSKRKAYNEVLRAIAKKDRNAYLKTALHFFKEIGVEEKDIPELLLSFSKSRE